MDVYVKKENKVIIHESLLNPNKDNKGGKKKMLTSLLPQKQRR